MSKSSEEEHVSGCGIEEQEILILLLENIKVYSRISTCCFDAYYYEYTLIIHR